MSDPRDRDSGPASDGRTREGVRARLARLADRPGFAALVRIVRLPRTAPGARPRPRTRTLALGVALALVAAVRLLPLPAVYRDGDVVLSANDPYHYRYLVEATTAAAASPLDVGTLLSVPGAERTGEPLMVATLAAFAEVGGGGPWVAGTVLAWYPVGSALVTGLLVYALAARLADDWRVGVVAVGLLAVVPGHAFRTGLGYADHHAFDYVPLTLSALALVSLLTGRRVAWPPRRRTVALATALAVGVAGQVLAWEAGPLLLVPTAVAVALHAPYAVHRGRVDALAPVAGGLLGGAVLALLAHAAFGWQSLAVAFVPALLAAGALAVLAASVAVTRLDLRRPATTLLVVELLGVGLVALVATGVLPGLHEELRRGVAFLGRTSDIGETQSLTDAWGPVFGPLVMLGFTPFLALPAMAWALRRAAEPRGHPWFLVAPHAWFLLGLSLVQRRFTGELAPFLAAFAALGLLSLTAALGLTRAPRVLRRGRDRDRERNRDRDRDGGGPADGRGDPRSGGSDAVPGATTGVPLTDGEGTDAGSATGCPPGASSAGGPRAPDDSDDAGSPVPGAEDGRGRVDEPGSDRARTPGDECDASRGEDSDQRGSLPRGRRAVMLGALGAVLGGFPAAYSAAIHARLTTDPARHRAAVWMREYAGARGWEYPRNYVLVEWDLSRMFNYFVNGESESYAFAREHYEAFVFSDRPAEWYERLRGRVGFVVTREGYGRLARLHRRLHEAFGSRHGGSPGLAHYRAVYASADGATKVFTLVPGARLEGTLDPGETLALRTSVPVAGLGTTVEYARRVEVDADGAVSVTVPHPGEYRVEPGGRRVTVPERAVVDGRTVALPPEQ